jgi:regulator of sigma E protease
VRILGEELSADSKDPAAFSSRPRWQQAIVLLAGVSMNVLLAWTIFVFLLIAGIPQALSENDIQGARDVRLAVSHVLPGSPAEEAGILPGDTIFSVAASEETLAELSPQTFTDFVAQYPEEEITLSVGTVGQERMVTTSPRVGIIESAPEKSALGVGLSHIGIKEVSFFGAVSEATILTGVLLKSITIGLITFFGSALTLSANLSDISGPVGIAAAVGSASTLGWQPLLQLAAIISLNLAIINLIPIPALDGGRLLFVLIESVIRRPIKQAFANTANTIGFVFLLGLMVVVTVSDVIKIF